MPAEGVLLSKGAAKRTAETVRRVLGSKDPIGQQPAPQGRPGKRYFGKLASSLAAGSMSSPSSCTFNVWFPDPASTATPPPWIVTTDSALLGFTVYNLDPSLEGEAGYCGKIEFEYGVWTFYWIGCDT